MKLAGEPGKGRFCGNERETCPAINYKPKLEYRLIRLRVWCEKGGPLLQESVELPHLLLHGATHCLAQPAHLQQASLHLLRSEKNSSSHTHSHHLYSTHTATHLFPALYASESRLGIPDECL